MRLAIRLLAALVALLLVLTLAGVLLVQQQLAAAGVDQVDWQGPGWSDGALQLDRLSLRYRDEAGAQLIVESRGLLIEPAWSGGPGLAVLQADQLEIDWQPAVDAPDNQPARMPDLQQLADSLQWLPSQRLAAPRVQIQMPCGPDICTLNGALTVERDASGRFLLQLRLLAKEGSIELDGYLLSNAQGLEADIDLQLSGQPAAALQTHWTYGETAPRSQGLLTLPGWPQADWLLAYAQPWLGQANPAVDSLPTGLRGEVRWSLAPLDRPQTLAGLLSGAVELHADMALADPWYLPQLGAFAGEMTLDLLGDAGLWQLRQGSARLLWSELELPALVALPAQVRPLTIELDVKAQAESQLAWTSTLPFIIKASVTGPVTASLTGPVAVVSQPQWQAQWESMQLQVAAARLDLDPVQLRQLKLDLPFAGQIDGQQLEVQFLESAILTLDKLTVPGSMVLGAVRSDVSGLELQIPLGDPLAAEAAGPLTINAGRVEQAALKPQAWTVQGVLARDAAELRWTGTVAAASDLGLELAFAWPAGSSWRADIELEPTFLRAGDPLSATLAAWPELLTLGSGRILGQISLQGEAELERASGRLELDEAAGIYDRLTFQGLSSVVAIDLAGDRLQLDMPSLVLEALDPGIAMGPLSADLHYAAHLERPAAGLLRIEQAQLQVLGGQVAVEPTALDLSAERHAVVVDIRGVELSRLFAAYPAEGLRGRGTLDGQLPVILVDGELMIDEGELDARAPGGFLQYRSEKLENLAESTPGMRQVAQALDDFHYDLLNADVSYREGGILVLGLELKGRNPAVQDGRPIHLNIQLEEDIPALLASLQLSGKVSEVIQERIRQRLLRKRADP